MKTRGMVQRAGIAGFACVIACLALGFALVWLAACDQAPQGQAAEFVADIQGRIKQFAPKLAPLLKAFDKQKADSALMKLFQAQSAAGKPITIAIALLDQNGMYLTDRYPEKGKAGGAQDKLTGKQGYGSYKAVKICLDKQRVTQLVLYWENEKIYAICVPLAEGGDTLGAMVLAFGEPFLAKYPGLTEKQFLDLDLDAP